MSRLTHGWFVGRGVLCAAIFASCLFAGCHGGKSAGGSGDSIWPVTKSACAKQCDVLSADCSSESERNHAQASASCTVAGGDVAACQSAADRTLSAARAVCATAGTTCSTCCSANGSNCAAINPEVPEFAGTFQLPDRNELTTLDLPPGPNGRGLLLGRLPDGTAWMDPSLRTPVTAAAECASAMLSCYEDGTRNYAGCFAAVPVCNSDTPWTEDGPACCAASCGHRYQELRRAGRDDPTAMVAAIYEAPSCMPGVQGHQPEPPR